MVEDLRNRDSCNAGHWSVLGSAASDLGGSHGFQVNVVNARHTKTLPGRKTDVLECQWLQKLHTSGLLNNSFRPAAEIRVLRTYLRQRESLVAAASKCTQHMQKTLTQMNVQLANVISDISGATGMAILRAIVDGERDPDKLASRKNSLIRASRGTNCSEPGGRLAGRIAVCARAKPRTLRYVPWQDNKMGPTYRSASENDGVKAGH